MASAELKTLLAHEDARGVFWLKAHAAVNEISAAAKARKWAFFHLEGQKIEKKEQFLNHAAVAMKFPAHFGHNWDAFYDCLTDLDWVNAGGYLIYFDHTEAFQQHHESQLETAVELFQDAVDYWKEEGKSMLVLLSGSEAPAGIAKV